MNFTWPGRIHLISTDQLRLYLTLWLFGRRFHFDGRSALDVDGTGWMAGAASAPAKQRKQ